MTEKWAKMMIYLKKCPIFSVTELKSVLNYATTAQNHALGYWKSELKRFSGI